MKVQQIRNYKTQYSSNKIQQSDSNPNFGMHIACDGLVRANISHIAGPKNLQRILSMLCDWGQDANMAAKFRTAHHHNPKLSKVIPDFDPHKLPHWDTTEVTPKLSFKDGHYKVKFEDNRKPKKCSGYGVSTKHNPADAVIEAFIAALRNYAGNRIFEDMV